MTVFQDENEVYRYLGGIFERAFDDPEVGPKLKKADLGLRVDYKDPKSTLFVDMGDGEILTGSDAESQDWDVALGMSADDGHEFWLGNLNFTVAMTKGQIRTKGPVKELLKLLPLARPLFAQYEELLREDGREDLLKSKSKG